ncbi:MAG: CaiB/BaiF CoA transferase family protein [Parahaliea sp.]
MGPLKGFTVLELAGIGPAPMAGMMLADMGAEVIFIERTATSGHDEFRASAGVSLRGKKSVVLNLKTPAGVDSLLRMVEHADVLIDPYRPGVCEKLGFGPGICLQRNPRLIFARMTGWGQAGPLAHAAGHDINYIALTGALYAIGTAKQKPVPPLNLVGDMGGGGMLLANGILAALLEASRSGEGQVIDAAMVDGAAQLMWMFHSLAANGNWDVNARGVNLLDGGAHFYGAYECADGKYIALGSIEPRFYAQLMELARLSEKDFSAQYDRAAWPEMKDKLAVVIRQKTRSQWCELMEGTDVCFAPVLSLAEAPAHPANTARQTYIEVDGITQPAPAPRFSRTPSQVRHGAHDIGQDTRQVLLSMAFTEQEIEQLEIAGTIT